jgi:hypothetical protein
MVSVTGAVIDQRRLVAPAVFDVDIQGIVAGVELPAVNQR